MKRAGVHRARQLGAALLFASGLATCGPSGPDPTNDAECRASGACREKGQCAFNRSTKKCVVGSSQDCAESVICNKRNLCKKVGDTCGLE